MTLQAGADGSLAAICADGYFFLPPACRENSSQCVPYLTADPGLGLDDIMQKATAYNMPLAIGVAKDWTTLSAQVRSVFYWWRPDTTFLDLDPVELVFPPYDFNAYTMGDKRTRQAGASLTKIVSQDLTRLAPRIEDFVRNVRLNIIDVMDTIKDMHARRVTHLDAHAGGSVQTL